MRAPESALVIRSVFAVAVAILFTGCAGTSLPYKPEQQPSGAKVSAAYQVIGDRLRIEIDTGGRRLEEAKILRPDGSELHPQTVEHAPTQPAGYPSSGGTWGSRSGAVIGAGVSTGVPVGDPGRVEGTTLTFFPLEQAGPGPWQLRVKLVHTEPVIIVVGGPPPSKK